MLDQEGFIRHGGLKDSKGYYAWIFADRDNHYLRFAITARASPPWFKQPHGQILSVHRTTTLTERFGHHLIVVALRRTPDNPIEFYVLDPVEIKNREIGRNKRHGSVMVNFRFKLGQRWYPGDEGLSKVQRRLGDRQRQANALRQQSLYLRADGRLVA